MPMTGHGWELLIERTHEQQRASDGKRRTIGRYRLFHNGGAVAAISGQTAECGGPSDNATPGSARRILPGRYPLATQAGTKYVTLNYTQNANQAALPRPGLELLDTGRRREILIHPGIGFLASIGCINLARHLPDALEAIAFPGSRARVIALIDDLRAFSGPAFPHANGRRIANAHVVIEGEPPPP